MVFFSLFAPGGCGSGVAPTVLTGDLVDGNRGAGLTGTHGKTSGEPNNAFSQAITGVFDEEGIARLQGTIASIGDLDVFLLGALSPGDRVIVDANTTGSPLDISVALFDGWQRLVYNSDDRGGTNARALDSYIEWITRHQSDSYYLVVTHSAFAASGHYTGSYSIDIGITGGFAVPEPAGQILLLDFDGGEVNSPVLGSMTLMPFNAGAISPVYRGRTEIVKETIRAVFDQNFARFNVTIWTSDDPPLPDGTMFSTIHFGGFDHAAFGIAEGVDPYNADCCDDALVFTESFEPLVFSIVPTAVEMGTAIANVGSHEAGHLLGLNHVSDDRALMDDHSPADAFLADQEFMEAILSSDIMPIGTQDAVLLLDETVGPSLR